jgi:hypothetical protein
MAPRALDQLAQPAGRREDVVVDQGDQVGRGYARAFVACRVRPAWRVVHECAHAMTADHVGRGIARSVVDDDDLVGLVEVLVGQRSKRHV